MLEKAGKKDSYLEESLSDLGRFWAQLGYWHAAEPYYRKRLNNVQARRGTNHIETAYALFSHGQALQHFYRFKSAEDALLRAEYTARWKLGRYSVGAGYAKALLGRLYLRMDRNEEAAKFLSQGLKQMGTFKRTTRYYNDGFSSRRQERQSVFQPKSEDAANVLVDYAQALQRLGRNTEAETMLTKVRTILSTKLKYPLPNYFIQRRFGLASEATGDITTAEKFFYTAAQAAYSNPAASDRQKLKANMMLFAFHIRHDQQVKATAQESILFLKKASDDAMDAVISRNEGLAAARKARPKEDNGPK